MAAALIFLSLQINTLVTDFLSHPTTTSVSFVGRQALTLPAVTICNYNPIKKDYVRCRFYVECTLLPANYVQIRVAFENGRLADIPLLVLLKFIAFSGSIASVKTLAKRCIFEKNIGRDDGSRYASTRKS
uniref:Uncharacterized protein n=1 Tax=Parascaris equorum TaxID=6256 RepID=A0A914S0K4_PAREQ